MTREHEAVFVLFAVHGMARDFSRTAAVPFVMDRVNELHHLQISPASAPPSPAKHDAISPTCGSGAVQHAIGQAVPVGVRDWVVQRATASGHDWSRTPGLALLADRAGYIRLNRQGREAKVFCVGKHRGKTLHGYNRYRISRPCRCQDGRTDRCRCSSTCVALFRSAIRLFARFVCDLAGHESSSRARSDRLGLLPREPQSGRTGNHTADGFAVIVSTDGDLTALPPLNSVTDLARWVTAAVSPISQQ